MNFAFDWLKNNNIALDADYPYVSGDGSEPKCDKNYKKYGLRVPDYVIVEEKEKALIDAIEKQPVAVAIMANQDCFMKY
jgi:hypothetical protein